MNDQPLPPAASAATPVAPLLRYRIQEQNGQVYVGYFLANPSDGMRLRLIARTQHPSRNVADGHMVRRSLDTCAKKRIYLVQMVCSNETGAFAFWDNETDALTGARASEQACVIYRPDGTWEAL